MLFLLCGLLLFLSPPTTQELKSLRKEQGNLVMESIPEIPQDLARRVNQYLEYRRADLQGWAPEGGVYLLTRFGETPQLHHLARPDGARQQLSFGAEPISEVAISPAPGRLLFTQDRGGSEGYQVYLMDRKTGHSEQLTHKGRNGGLLWDRKGERFIFYGTGRNGRDWDIYMGRLDEAPKLLLEMEGTWLPMDWSFDGERVLLLHYVSITQSGLYALHLRDGRLEVLTSEEGAHELGRFAPDGSLYYSSDQGSSFKVLRRRFPTGADEPLSADIPWDVKEIALSPDGAELAFLCNEGGMSRLYLQEGRTRRAIKTPIGQISTLHYNKEGKLAFTLESAKSSADIFSLDSKDALERWTQSEIGGMNPEGFIEPKLIHYPSFDQHEGAPRSIPAFLYQASNEELRPVVIYIHGGPEAQFRPRFSSTIQFLVKELDFVVLAPNVRGSAGYGKEYLRLDNGFLREDSVRDIGALLDWIKDKPGMDTQRVAVVGGSYGGYMVLASLIHFPERLKAGVDVVGISHFLTFLKNTKDYRRDLRRVEYGDERDPKMARFLERISPLSRAKEIKAPLFIVQGMNDPRVPVSEAEQILAAVRGGGQPAWYLMAKDEGHGFRKKRNRDVYMQTMMLFLKTQLGEAAK